METVFLLRVWKWVIILGWNAGVHYVNNKSDVREKD